MKAVISYDDELCAKQFVVQPELNLKHYFASVQIFRAETVLNISFHVHKSS